MSSIAALSYNNDCQSWIRQRGIGCEESNPTTRTNAGACLASYGLRWIVRPTCRAVINGADHSGNHSLPDIGTDRKLTSDFRCKLTLFLGGSGNLRYQQLPTIRHSGNESAQLKRSYLKAICVGEHASLYEAWLVFRKTTRELKVYIRASLLTETKLTRVGHHLVETNFASDLFEERIIRVS